ncbi:uncharacterized protein L3040_005702 [Drepanopeziza brunnea f. sp. 'multigermtubi']|uniref:uncharacterized protein n=1 Tax=Drepanopeziza brunnea f. sp. 'multigermtubi' TaxID=698441 RepID=UPI0023A6B72C|nr:hypothetical protein L3040_005702 [Drepanopeziza brunnea f. sp. 'multigermtubi']
MEEDLFLATDIYQSHSAGRLRGARDGIPLGGFKGSRVTALQRRETSVPVRLPFDLWFGIRRSFAIDVGDVWMAVAG